MTISWLALATPSRADAPAKACIAAHAHAQLLERDRRLLAAASTLRECQIESCPALIRTDCAELAARVRNKTPSVRVRAAETDGSPIPLSRLTLDGVELERSALSRGFALDPGAHHLLVHSADGRSLEQRLHVTEGEHGRELTLRFAALPMPPAERAATSEGSPTLGYGLAGGGALGFAAFAFFGLNGNSTERELERCAPDCSQSAVRRMRTQYLAADISLGVGVALAASAAYVLLSQPEPGAPATARARVAIELAPLGQRGALAGARVHF